MAKDPAFLFYPGDYISGTMYLDFECKGAYMDLLMLQFQKDHMTIHMIKQVLGHRFEHIWSQISDKFQEKEGKYWNERLRVEKENRVNFCKSRKKNRSGHEHITNHMSIHMEDEDINKIKNEIERLIQENDESRFSSNELADYFYNWLTRLSIPAKREFFVKTGTGRDCRFDIMVFNTDASPSFIIEVKNYKNHDEYYKPLKQIERYSKHGLPILFVPNFSTSLDCLLQAKEFFSSRRKGNRFIFIPETKPDATSMSLGPQMVEVFKNSFPEYPVDQNLDFAACLEISYKIATAKGWTKESVVNGKQASVLSEWMQMVDFIKSDKWYSTRSISAINKQFQDLAQAIKNGGTTHKSGNIGGTPVVQNVTQKGTRKF